MNNYRLHQYSVNRGVGRNCRKGGLSKAIGFWHEVPETLRRGAAKIWGCNRKPHLLFNDSLTGSSPYLANNSYSVQSAHVQENSSATPSINNCLDIILATVLQVAALKFQVTS